MGRKRDFKIKADLEIIKNFLLKKDPEGELSDWAKNALNDSRATPESECISHEEVKKRFLR